MAGEPASLIVGPSLPGH